MYNHIKDVSVDCCKIASKMNNSSWMNKQGELVEDEIEGYGCKVNLRFNRPDMAIVMDEVGCNLSQEMDHSVGGKQYLTSVKGEAAQTSSTQDHHFICLGLTRLDGQPLMCVVMFWNKFNVKMMKIQRERY